MAIAWRRLAEAGLDLIYPPRCVACRRAGEWLCAGCLAQVRFLPPERRAGAFGAVDGAASAAYSEGPLREAIHGFKYEGARALAPLLGEMLYAGWLAARLPGEVVVPVPLHPRRLRERGYNQSQLLARELARLAGLRLDDRTLRRERHTRPQVTLNAAERRANVEGAFGCGPALAGEAVLLVDDVFTTGATLAACAAALKAAGARSVWALTLARAPGLTQSGFGL